ncbi:MAG: hypothetical protein JWO38_5451 [Gemmataceae bacterium]|nr:hypothetical protein [Gemmataceae bacterium]
MSMPEFMNRLRLVSSMLPPGVFSSQGLSDSPADERLRHKALASADVWLDPAFVAGVKAGDFFYLDEHERKELETALERFAKLAGEASRGHGLTLEQRSQGLEVLIKFVDVLKPVPAPDNLLIPVLWRLESTYPEYVLGFDCEFGTDSTGDPAVWVWVVVPDDADVESKAFDGFEKSIDKVVRGWLKEVGKEDVWPYIRLRTPSSIKDDIHEVVE